MREDERKDNHKLEGSIRIVSECDECPDRGNAECKRYRDDCEGWNSCIIEKVSYGGGIYAVREGVLFSEIKNVYKEVLEEIRKETDDRLRGKRKK